jgi:hypothetical protein
MGRQIELKPYTLSAASSPFLRSKDEAVRSTLEIPMKVEKLVCFFRFLIFDFGLIFD